MILNALSYRNLDPNEWALALFAIAFLMLAIVKSTYEKRFASFFRLGVSDKYLKVYRDSSNIKTSFTILIFVANLVSTSFLIHLTATRFGYGVSDYEYHFAKNDGLHFVRIFTLLTVFVLIKYLVEKIVVTLFSAEEMSDYFNLQKISYKSFIGVVFLPIVMLLFYNSSVSDAFLYGVIGAFLLLNLVFYVIILVNFREIIFRNLFYFILYLCTLEIAPYYFIYYLIIKN